MTARELLSYLGVEGALEYRNAYSDLRATLWGQPVCVSYTEHLVTIDLYLSGQCGGRLLTAGRKPGTSSMMRSPVQIGDWWVSIWL
jgi:hypothetical protein